MAKSVEKIIRLSTCRIDSAGEQLGSCFWVDDNQLLTAAHVTEAAEQGSITVRTSEGETIEGEVIREDLNTDENPGSDIAVIKTEEQPDKFETLPINKDLPSIGTDVVWSGYARLMGESKIDRQRFGWGKVASVDYGNNEGSFFEVDGLFNPSHSGGPVVVAETGQVVGVVSASAGGFERLKQEWTKRVNLLQELLSLSKNAGGMMFRTYTYTQPEDAIKDKALFEQMGLSVESDTDDEGNMTLQIDVEEIPVAASQIQSELAKLLLDTAQATFQMGVGIASGGPPLDKII